MRDAIDFVQLGHKLFTSPLHVVADFPPQQQPYKMVTLCVLPTWYQYV